MNDQAKTITLGEANGELVENYKNPRVGMETPFVWINKKTGGIAKGEVFTIAARTGAGKSCFALQMLTHFSHRYRTLYVTLEMTEAHQAARYLASITDLNSRDLIRGSIQDAELFMKAVAAVGRSPIADNMRLSRFANTVERVMEITHNCGAEVVVIDTINLMKSSGETERIRLTNITRSLKQMALNMDVAVIMVAQLNREADGKMIPVLSDIKESGSIEEDSDTVLLFADVEDYGEIFKAEQKYGVSLCDAGEFSQMREGMRQCVFASIRKNRNGETGATVFWFMNDKHKFIELQEARERNFVPF